MDFIEKLTKLKKEIDEELQRYLSVVIKKTEKQDKETAKILKQAEKIIMSGGKRIRPILMYFGYVAAGGKDKKKIIKAAIGIELIHNFLLMHDDVMDHGQKRHGVETINAVYAKINRKNFNNDFAAEHFGNSMAINAGDFLHSLGIRAILNSGFQPELIYRTIFEIESIITTTVIGQVQDIFMENKKDVSEKEVLEMYKNKTARYTIGGPFRLGAILAKANPKFLEKINLFAIPLGMAFQIQDDILGVFETSKKLGKDSGADIKEGKKTLLIINAIKNAEKKDKIFLKKELKNGKISAKKITRFKDVLKKTCALEYNQNLTEKLIKQGKREIQKIKMDKETKLFLLDLADYIVFRNV